MNDLERLLSDLETNENLRAWFEGSANEAAADIVLSDLDYDVTMAELREVITIRPRTSQS